ncbi:hypothetical protein Btru_030378 [Bulinus truncatus]|nr:hypothetical protein Btru_030378 [Bulinus truncatus]
MVIENGYRGWWQKMVTEDGDKRWLRRMVTEDRDRKWLQRMVAEDDNRGCDKLNNDPRVDQWDNVDQRVNFGIKEPHVDQRAKRRSKSAFWESKDRMWIKELSVDQRVHFGYQRSACGSKS